MIGHVKIAGDGFLELGEDRLKCLIKTNPITDVYNIEQTPFARGKFASVRRLVHKSTGVAYAGKFIRRRRRAADVSRDIAHEMAVLDMCAGSQRVVRLVEVYETRAEVTLVLELATGGELQHLLDADERLPEADARRALRDTLLGLRDLHKHNVAHLDLKPQNLLLCKSENSSDLGEVKLCDFGISRLIQPGVEVREIMGTPDYVAPEVLQYERLSLATDIWSVGVLAYVLLSGFSPFAGDTKQETFLNISQAELSFPDDLFDGVSDTAMDFVKACLVVHPSSRPSVHQCLEHPWFTDGSIKSCLMADAENKNTSKTAAATNSICGQNDTKMPPTTSSSSATNNHHIDAKTAPPPTAKTTATNGNCKTEQKNEVKTTADGPASEKKTAIITPLLKPNILTKATAASSVVYLSFPDAPTTPKVSRKSHLLQQQQQQQQQQPHQQQQQQQQQQQSSVLSLCKKFQQNNGDTVDSCVVTTVDKQQQDKKDLLVSLEEVVPSKETAAANGDSGGGTDNFGNFENSVAYTMTCLLCSQCGGQCCHIPRKSLSMERGIIC